jgi:hypothetical protein
MESFIIQGTFSVPTDKLSNVKSVLESLTNPLLTSKLESDETELYIKLNANTVEEMASTLNQVGPHIEELSNYAESTEVVCVGEMPQVLIDFLKDFNTKYLNQRQFNEAYG